MKVTITPEGAVELDVSDAAEAVALVRELQNQPKADEERQISAEVLSLTPKQREVYDVLMKHDCPDGCHIQAVADKVQRGYGATGQVLQVLKRRGLAMRVSSGHYRAITVADGRHVDRMLSGRGSMLDFIGRASA